MWTILAYESRETVRNKTKLRVVGEVVTLINNILITLGIAGGMIYLYLLQSVSMNFIENTLSLGYYDDELNIIKNILSFFNESIGLIVSIVIVIIALIWVFRAIIIRSTTIIITIIAIIISAVTIQLNAVNIIGVVGYSLILCDNIQLKNNKSRKYIEIDDEEEYTSNNTLKYVIMAVLLIVVVSIISKVFKADVMKVSDANKLKIEKNEKVGVDSPSVDIRVDYENKKITSEKVATQRYGIYRYHELLIDYLREYDINNIDNAKVVYELSDELLNNMYQEFKNYFDEHSFNELRDEQRMWVRNKALSEKDVEHDELLKYQTFINMTLERCEEWNDYYNK